MAQKQRAQGSGTENLDKSIRYGMTISLWNLKEKIINQKKI